jgi:hypothetical protein
MVPDELAFLCFLIIFLLFSFFLFLVATFLVVVLYLNFVVDLVAVVSSNFVVEISKTVVITDAVVWPAVLAYSVVVCCCNMAVVEGAIVEVTALYVKGVLGNSVVTGDVAVPKVNAVVGL